MKNKRVVITRLGGPDVLELIEDDVPDPTPHEAQVRVLATGVAYADVLMRHGMYPGAPKLPYSPGYDIYGTVEKTGASVHRVKPGDTVAALVVRGGYSQYVNVAETELVPVVAPECFDPAEAVALVLNYTTAHQMLERIAKAKTGQRLLVHAAGGGVGTAALELGACCHMHMWGTASEKKHELVRCFGAHPIDYRKEDFVSVVKTQAGGVDIALDPIGGENWKKSYEALAPGGNLIVYGMQSAISERGANKLAATASFAWLALTRLRPGKSVHWYSITGMKKKHPDWFLDDLLTLFEFLREARIKPVIAEKLPLSEARRAHELLESGQVIGKIVLLPNA